MVSRSLSPGGHLLQRRLISAGLDGAPVTIIDSLTAQKRLVETHFGIALVPESSVRDEIRLGSLKEIIEPSVRTSVPVAVIHRRKGFLNATARALLAILNDTSLSPAEKSRPRNVPASPVSPDKPRS